MNINQVKSNLKMNNFYFSNYSFERQSVIEDGEYNIDLEKSITKVEEHIYNVSLKTTINKTDMKLEIISNAQFIYEAEEYSKEKSIIDTNTVAIMFPFVRSQVTLMTSQPGMTPVVLPTINTAKLK